ncbi:MAG: peptide ABC transporter substrate-binding protein [Armatimonadota bacterium]|nr:peptide ABC transporter substrate-binding protein [Armatimonadota bacterium]MDR7452064.1 peptide ABC transporter substrate-binding protein [Armatimonadota bacterium]MDR7466526.1 peptide ABC transporter substrate-binding protein [Armatimonadota bacterium]MDR7493248.1 peptide ABC transporter substrate-binding protein [Armatimonadota bacterium]MDR7499859.1 peptide ABC transporter substrate-binding protein [Armatimonadota bacterium]
MRARRQWSLLLLALLLTLTLVPWQAARAQQTGPAAGRDQVVIGMSQEPDFLNPMFAEMAAAVAVLDTIFVSDIERDNTWKLFAQGVEAIPNLKDGTWKLDGDRMTLVWKIKPRNWSDGRPVTCADFVFTHNVARNEQVPVIVRDLTNRISNIVCTKGASGTDITVNWKERYAYANLTITEYGALPRHVLEKYYRANPSKLNEAPYGNDPAITIGDGAYKLVEWRKGASMTVEAVPNHKLFGTPKIRRITWRFIPDTNALVANMLSGAIDAIGTIGITFDQAVQLERQAAGRFKVFFEEGLIWEHIDFMLDNPLLADVRVRRAIAHGINREQMVQQLFGGKQPVSHSYLPTKHPGYPRGDQGVTKYPYDPARARALLQEAGFSPGPDGVMRNAQGQRLSFELNTTAGNRVREQVEQIIQQNLREIGIEIKIQNYPARVYFGEITNRRKFPGLAMYAWVMSPTSDCDQLYTSDGIPNEGNGWAGQNYPGYKNAEMDRLCKAASREVDEAKRNQLLNQTVQLFSRDIPALPLYIRASVAAAKPGLQGFTAVQLSGTYETWNAHRWFWQ